MDLTLRACVILIVTFFEEYVKGLFVNRLNKHPKRALRFLDQDLKIRQLLIEYDFDFSNNMGDIISDKINFQNIERISETYQRAFKIDIFNKNKSLEKKLNKLFQDRHIIVHNNGRIDKKYVSIIKCSKNKIGETIKITFRDLDSYKKTILKIADNIEKEIQLAVEGQDISKCKNVVDRDVFQANWESVLFRIGKLSPQSFKVSRGRYIKIGERLAQKERLVSIYTFKNKVGLTKLKKALKDIKSIAKIVKEQLASKYCERIHKVAVFLEDLHKGACIG